MRSIILASLVVLTLSKGDQCMFPRPVEGFTQEWWEGTWFEIAKYQTAGGAIFEKDCVCTELKVYTSDDKYKCDNICRKKTPEGREITATATLTPDGTAGHFKESFFPLAPAVNYTIVLMGERDGDEYSVEYDCESNFLGTNYCIHIFSRKPTMSESTLSYLLEVIDQLELNMYDLDLQLTLQANCWNTSTVISKQIL